MFHDFSDIISKTGCKGALVDMVMKNKEFKEECEDMLKPELRTIAGTNSSNVLELIRLNPYKLLCYGVMESVKSACNIFKAQLKEPPQINQDAFCTQPRQYKIPSDCKVEHCELLKLMSETVLKNASMCSDTCMNQEKTVPVCLYFDMILKVLFTGDPETTQVVTKNLPAETMANIKTEDSKPATDEGSSGGQSTPPGSTENKTDTEEPSENKDKSVDTIEVLKDASSYAHASETEDTSESTKVVSEAENDEITAEDEQKEVVEDEKDTKDEKDEEEEKELNADSELKGTDVAPTVQETSVEEKIDKTSKPAKEITLPEKETSAEVENMQPFYKGSQAEDTMNTGVFSEDQSNFFAYFLLLSIVCIIAYLVFHNKQKILALILEGRRSQSSRRRSGGREYRKLGNLEDSMDINRESSLQQVIY